MASLFSGRPDNPVTETGILSERRRHGWSSRVGSTRVDTHHAWIDPIIVAGLRVAPAGRLLIAVEARAERSRGGTREACRRGASRPSGSGAVVGG
ncbi:hypothetical protein NY547_12825 [Cnuibacter physcomitrellae]|uniref:hypothetical protein n=1 Tax=Cnuibacter physcomitrellae TaxID=1619308 RepID=UPI002175A48B|nr:hypothetical protein [Cnuibacter physcomitrellae]MCS5498127.1 hypothetical protein [Cnuibacter physcomitrellae]